VVAKDYDGFQDSNSKKASMDFKTDVTGADKTYPSANLRGVSRNTSIWLFIQMCGTVLDYSAATSTVKVVLWKRADDFHLHPFTSLLYRCSLLVIFTDLSEIFCWHLLFLLHFKPLTSTTVLEQVVDE
jgi:hypothetical protein